MAENVDFETSMNAHKPDQSLKGAAPRRWFALVATSLGLFMAMLDITVVNVALPTIGNDLKASFADLQWIINAYSLALAVLYVIAGRLGDIFGRKRVFIAGGWGFSLSDRSSVHSPAVYSLAAFRPFIR